VNRGKFNYLRRVKIAGVIGLLLLSGFGVWWKLGGPRSYRVVSVQSGYAVQALSVSRGRTHDMWSAGEFEIFVSRLLGQTALTRAVRAKLMRPISFFSAGTVEPTIGLIVRFTGDIAANELAGLNARLLIGTNEHRLTLKHSAVDRVRGAFIACWTTERSPARTDSVQLRIGWPSGTELVRLELNSDQFGEPLLARDEDRKEYITKGLREFLEGKKSAEEILQKLHRFYEEYGSPEYATAFEMIYYELEAVGSSKSKSAELEDHLRSEALDWLDQAKSKTESAN
jgi:hypothetical protein